MYGNRLVIPASLRKEVLECLHAAHQGVAGMKARAATCVYWPGISAGISNRRIQCRTCNTIAPSQAKQRHFGRIEKLALLSKETLLFYNGRQLLCTRVPQQEGASEGESILQATKR